MIANIKSYRPAKEKVQIANRRVTSDTMRSTSLPPVERFQRAHVEANSLASIAHRPFEQLVDDFTPRLLSVAKRFLRNDEDAADAVQDAFLAAFVSRHRFKGESSVYTWLYRIVVNVCLMKLRSRANTHCISLEALSRLSPDGCYHEPTVSFTELPVIKLESEEMNQLVRRCIDMLPNDYRNIILLRDIEQLDTDQASQQLKVSHAVVKTRLHRARRALRHDRVGDLVARSTTRRLAVTAIFAMHQKLHPMPGRLTPKPLTISELFQILNTKQLPLVEKAMKSMTHEMKSSSTQSMSMMHSRRIWIGVAIIAIAGAWFLFRPELLFVNKTVNESLPAAASPMNNPNSMNDMNSSMAMPLSSGSFHSVAHDTKGTATIHKLADGKNVLRLTQFETSNGPDVHVFLVAAADATDSDMVKQAGYFDLGSIKGNIGDQNYEIPADVNLEKYHAVTIWCNRFGVNFGTAPLAMKETQQTFTSQTEPVQMSTGMFHSVAHETKGTAAVFKLADNKRVLRLTNFETSNGPDVRVYLVAAQDAADSDTVKNAGFIELGKLKGNIGDQNYDIPEDLDLAKYQSVTVWCARFGVNFGTAPLK